MDPPPCIQNAMMTKDKKPFTYTPGGIDLSEVRSPRMARRIERNAHLGGVEETPRPQQSQPADYSSLPPSTLAAMRPQPQVQVFPSGPPPPGPIRGGMAPPPPPPMNIPPPPPPPSCPLPTQKIRMSDNQTLERPDMTKIIPDNPMALLRKTSGPAPRTSVVDELYQQGGRTAPTPRSPPTSSSYGQDQPRYQQPVPPVPQQQNQIQNRTQVQAQERPQPPQPIFRPAPPQQQYSPEVQSEESRYQPPVVERKPSLQKQHNEPNGTKTSTAHLGQLYIPPANQQQQQKRVVSPPSPPERSPNSPQLQTPPLREAPRPWQTKKAQQEELPPWTRKENETESGDSQTNYQVTSPPSAQLQPQAQQPRWPQSRPVQQTPVNQQIQPQQRQIQQPQTQYQTPQKQQQYSPQPQYNQQQPIGVRIEIRTKPQPYDDSEPESKQPHAVYVTQPLVFQHPGPMQAPMQQQQRQQVVRNEGATVRSVQAEGSDPRTPSTPKSLNRQQSWGSNPTQSNSFKIIQKITQTDDDDEYEDTPVTQHSARYPQNFQQPSDQMRRMKLQENEQNRFRQEIDHYYEDNPRYRGGYIYSKLNAIFEKQGSGGPQSDNKQPQVRMIPIQMEDDGPPQKYVHPSEQVVPEPKKYTGSAIPSRSFKMLQAMTAAPDNCANADEQYEAPLYDQWAYPPYPYPPYWYNYYHNYYYPESHEELSEDSEQKDKRRKTPTPRTTPVPFWEYAPPYNTQKIKKIPSEESYESSTSSRSTPLPFWNPEYYYPPETDTPENSEENNSYPYYPPYYDPYYYHYYYGYPPMYPPPPYYYGSGSEDFNGYSSAEEFNSFKRNSNSNLKRSDSSRSKITSPLDVKEKVQSFGDNKENKSDFEIEEKEITIPVIKLNSLKSIKSVNDMNIYDVDDDLDNAVQIEECSDYTTEDTDEETSVYAEEEDEYPHQLSVIMEESERTESRIRSLSVMSDTSTLSGKTGVDDDEPQLATITLPERSRSKSKDLEEVTASFIFKSPCATPRISQDREKHDDEDDDEDETDDGNNNDDEDYIEETSKVNEDVIEKQLQVAVNHEEVVEEDDKESDGSEDWWGIIGKNEEELPRSKTPIQNNDVFKEPQEEAQASNEIEIHNNTIEKYNDDVPEENKRRSVYDLDDDEDDEEDITTGGTILEMESFVEQLEQLKRNSGLWNLSKAKSRSKINNDKNSCEVSSANSQPQSENRTNTTTWNKETKSQNVETKPSSTDYSRYSYSESPKPVSTELCNFEKHNSEENLSDSDDSSETETSSSDDEEPQNILRAKTSPSSEEKEVKMLSIQERIAALKESIKQKQNKIQDQESKISVKEKISAIETNNHSRSKTTSTKSSVKSFEEYSEEEEVDSGVTSDMSRHISDNEEFPELKKLTRYQRAATHSRLFKLLQEECENEEDDEENDTDTIQTEPFRRDLLNLPLNKFSESESSISSGKSSPNLGINEKLVNELVQSLLKRKKGQVFKSMPREKLYAAAAKVLQEEIDILETPSDYGSFLSPLRNGTGYSTAAQTPQEFNNIYDEYKQYYESWRDADNDNIDLRTGLLAKGSKTISSKHFHKKIMKLLDSSESSPSPLSNKPLDSNEVTTAS